MGEMARPKGEAIKAVFDWAAQQPGNFTIRDLYKVYTANGGRADTAGENLQSFTTQIMKYIARPWKDGEKAEVSEKRPMLAVKQGSRGAGNPHIVKWALGKPLRDPTTAKFVNPGEGDDEQTSGDAMDRLEELIGADKLKAAMTRWKKMPDLNRVVADIRGTIPKKGQMDALHIASEFLMDRGAADEDEIEDAEAEVAPAPQAEPDEEEDLGDFSDEPDEEPDEYENDEEPAPAPTFQRTPTAKAKPEPEEPDEPEEDEPEEEPAGAPGAIKKGDRVRRNWAGVSSKEMAKIPLAMQNRVGTVVQLVQGKDNSGRSEPAAKVKWEGEGPDDTAYTFLLSELEPADGSEREAGAQNFLGTSPPKPQQPAQVPAASKPKGSLGSLMKGFGKKK